jgi:hypothetical protein
MIRSVSLMVLLILTAPPVAALACELLVCADGHHAAAAPAEDCHDHGGTDIGPSSSGLGTVCHDAADGPGDAVVTAGTTLVIAAPAASPLLAVAPPVTVQRHVLSGARRSGPTASLLANGQLRI